MLFILLVFPLPSRIHRQHCFVHPATSSVYTSRPRGWGFVCGGFATTQPYRLYIQSEFFHNHTIIRHHYFNRSSRDLAWCSVFSLLSILWAVDERAIARKWRPWCLSHPHIGLILVNKSDTRGSTHHSRGKSLE